MEWSNKSSVKVERFKIKNLFLFRLSINNGYFRDSKGIPMDQDINKIYHNTFGVSFIWKEEAPEKETPKIQIIFRDMGFYLTYREIITFQKQISYVKSINPCKCCDDKEQHRFMLLKTPCNQVDLAINDLELRSIDDLINGTLFHLDLDFYIHEISKN